MEADALRDVVRDRAPETLAELDAVLGPPAAGEVPGGLYDDALFEHGRGRLLLHRPADEPPTRGRVHPVRLPAAELVVATHRGEHDGIDVTYGELGAWVARNALTVAGPVRERYLVGPRDSDDPADWRTEIGWPVFRVAE